MSTLLGKLKKLKEKLTISKGGKGTNRMLDFDLLYQLSYMTAIASAGVPRDLIFERSAELPCTASEYFKKVELTRKRLKYDYARACRVIGESADDDEVKGLLLRFSSSLISGEPEAEFLGREAKAVSSDYDNEYGRKLESMKMWTDAYISLILSAVLVVIIGIVSTMIWQIDTLLIIAMGFISVATTAIGVWLIYLISPHEVVVLRWAGTREQQLAQQLFKLVLPVAVIIGAFFMLLGQNLGIALLFIAAAIFPIGYIMTSDDRKIAKRDEEVGTFLRSLGGVSAALGTTVNSALSRIDLNAINVLRTSVKHLHTRMVAGIKTRLCWKIFIDETGSELANRSVGMFYDAIDVGGSAGMAGVQASAYSSQIALLRARRRTITNPFRWLCFTMHASVVVLLVFVTEVILAFARMVTQANESLPTVAGTPPMSAFTSFNLSGLELMQNMVLPLVLIFTVANAIAPTVADGGSRYKILYNLGITAAFSGIALLVLPPLAEALFSSAAQF